MRQGKRKVSDYAIDFRTLAAESEWNPAALTDAFFQGLSESVKNQLISIDLPEDLDSLIAMAVKIDKRLTKRDQERGRLQARSSPHHGWRSDSQDRPNHVHPPAASLVPINHPTEEPMQLGRTHLPVEGRLLQQRDGRCYYCGQLGHLVSACHVKGASAQTKKQLMVSRSFVIGNPAQFLPQVKIVSDSNSLLVSVYIDSGADANLMNSSLIRRLGLRKFALQHSLEVKVVDGTPLGRITHHAQSVKLIFPDFHTEMLSFHVFDSVAHQVILGHPWLKTHNPDFDWDCGRVTSWGPKCADSCLPKSSNAAAVSDPMNPDLVNVPHVTMT